MTFGASFRLNIINYIWACQSEFTLPNEHYEQNPSVVVTILIANADTATMQPGVPHHAGLLIFFASFVFQFRIYEL